MTSRPKRAGTAGLRRERTWQRILKEQARSGLSHSEFCRQRSIPFSTYFLWRRKLVSRASRQSGGEPRSRRPAPTSSVVVPVRMKGHDGFPAPSSSSSYELVLGNGRVLRIPACFDDAVIARLLAVAEGTC
jgi:putative transposase